jgi:ABC-2 type transport system permease protein
MHRGMQRTGAIIERELRRFRRNPTMIVLSMLLPIVQLCILGYAFGGQVKHLKVGVVDQDHGLPAVKLRELTGAVRAGSRTFETVDYADPGQALADLRNGRIHAVLMIPPDFSRRMHQRNQPRLALIEDNTDNFVSATLTGSMGSLLSAFNSPAQPRRTLSQASLEVVEVYPFVPYVQYLLPGSIVMSIFTMVMIGGGINFVDDKARGLHEGYLVTPVKRFELIAGFNTAGTIKAVISGTALLIVGSFIAGVPNPLDPLRLMRLVCVVLVTAFALISLMFLLMVRTSNPMVPRAMFGMLSTVLYFPSGAVYPQQGFPAWLRAIAVADPFTYAVHALRSLLLKNTGFAAISGDLLFLVVFSAIAMTSATLLFKRTL